MNIFIFAFKKKRIVFSMGCRLLILLLFALPCSCASVSVKKSELLTASPPKRLQREFSSSPRPFTIPVFASTAARPISRLSNTTSRRNSLATS